MPEIFSYVINDTRNMKIKIFMYIKINLDDQKNITILTFAIMILE